jgi:hypothetical protein
MQAMASVKSFRSHAVVNGSVVVTDEAMVKHLDATYGEVALCHLVVSPGELLKGSYPQAFEAQRVDYENELAGEMRSQLSVGNDVDIEFH